MNSFETVKKPLSSRLVINCSNISISSCGNDSIRICDNRCSCNDSFLVTISKTFFLSKSFCIPVSLASAYSIENSSAFDATVPSISFLATSSRDSNPSLRASSHSKTGFSCNSCNNISSSSRVEICNKSNDCLRV